MSPKALIAILATITLVLMSPSDTSCAEGDSLGRLGLGHKAKTPHNSPGATRATRSRPARHWFRTAFAGALLLTASACSIHSPMEPSPDAGQAEYRQLVHYGFPHEVIKGIAADRPALGKLVELTEAFLNRPSGAPPKMYPGHFARLAEAAAAPSRYRFETLVDYVQTLPKGFLQTAEEVWRLGTTVTLKLTADEKALAYARAARLRGQFGYEPRVKDLEFLGRVGGRSFSDVERLLDQLKGDGISIGLARETVPARDAAPCEFAPRVTFPFSSQLLEFASVACGPATERKGFIEGAGIVASYTGGAFNGSDVRAAELLARGTPFEKKVLEGLLGRAELKHPWETYILQLDAREASSWAPDVAETRLNQLLNNLDVAIDRMGRKLTAPEIRGLRRGLLVRHVPIDDLVPEEVRQVARQERFWVKDIALWMALSPAERNWSKERVAAHVVKLRNSRGPGSRRTDGSALYDESMGDMDKLTRMELWRLAEVLTALDSEYVRYAAGRLVFEIPKSSGKTSLTTAGGLPAGLVERGGHLPIVGQGSKRGYEKIEESPSVGPGPNQYGKPTAKPGLESLVVVHSHPTRDHTGPSFWVDAPVGDDSAAWASHVDGLVVSNAGVSGKTGLPKWNADLVFGRKGDVIDLGDYAVDLGRHAVDLGDYVVDLGSHAVKSPSP